MKSRRFSTLFGLLVLTLFALLFSPQLELTDAGPQLELVQAVRAENPPANPNPPADPKPNDPPSDPIPKGKKEEEEEEEENPPADPKKDDPKPDPKPKGFDPDLYVSKEQYQKLEQQVQNMTKAQQERVVQSRVDHAISEQYVDSDDSEAVAEIRKIAASDEAWEAYKKVAKPKTPDHVTARRFQSQNLKSTRHTGNSGILEKVLEHQKA